MSEHTQDQVAAAPHKKAEPQHGGETGGVQALKAMLTHGNKPPPEEVAKLFARYTYDKDAMMQVLQQRAGISYTHQVVEAAKFAAELKEAKDPVADRTKHDVVADTKKGTFGDTRTATHIKDDGEDGKTIKTNVVGGTAGKIGQNGEYGVAVDAATSTEYEVGEGTSVKNTTAGGVQLTQGGAGAHIKHEKEAVMGGHQRGHGVDGSAAVDKDGNVDLDTGLSSTKGDSKGSTTKAVNAGYSTEKGATGGYTHTKKTTVGHDDDGTPKQDAVATGVKGHLGGETSGVDLTRSKAGANGTTKSMGGGVDIGENGISAHAGYSIMTKDGSGVSASASHGTKVVAKMPMLNLQTGQWEVAYVRTTTTGVSGSGSLGKGGFGASLGGGVSEAHFDSGVRAFKDATEATKFQTNAAEELGQPMFDPGTALGAMSIPVGETIGSGSSTAVSLNGSLAFEGASLGAGGSHTKTHELDVKRVDTQHVHVTMLVSGQDEKHVAASGNGISETWSKTDEKNQAITYQFDLLNPASVAAYEKFCKDRLPPDKALGVWVRTEATDSSEKKDDIGFAGGIADQSWTGTTKASKVTDAKGEHDQYDGTRANDVTTGRIGHFLGDKSSHASANLEAKVENGKEAGYTATIEVGGESGARNREALNQWFAMGDAKGTDATSSGDWKLEADVSSADVHKLEKAVHEFKGAKTPEEKQRILSEVVAKSGAVNIHDGKPLDWDVELAGDPNFPGRQGHDELDREIKQYTGELKDHPENAAGTLASINAALKKLNGRWDAVSDHKKYTDLPGELRQKVLAQIARFIGVFENLRDTAQVDSMQHNHSPATSKDPKLEGIRSRLDVANAAITRDDKALGVANKAVVFGIDHTLLRAEGLGPAKDQTKDFWQASFAAEKRAQGLDNDLTAAREAYLNAPDVVAAAEKLVKLTEDKASLVSSALTYMGLAASSLKPVLSHFGVGKSAEFWASVSGDFGFQENASG